jgi:carboxymethylenebutenolidase
MRTPLVIAAVVAAGVAGLVGGRLASAPAAHAESHDHPADVTGTAAIQTPGIPPGAAGAAAALEKSPRHGEWVTVKLSPTDSVVAWVVHPQRSDKAPVVVVLHENAGLTVWARSVADQMAADGFIAIAPELLTMRRTGNIRTEWARDSAVAANGTITEAEVNRWIDAVAKHAMALPNAVQKYGIVGFCAGGARSFLHAVHSPTLGASVIYYGGAPMAGRFGSIRAPMLGLYGGNDARITNAVPAVDSSLKALGKSFEYKVFPGAGHGFLRAQEPAGGPNLEASKQAWPMTVAFFKKHLGA